MAYQSMLLTPIRKGFEFLHREPRQKSRRVYTCSDGFAHKIVLLHTPYMGWGDAAKVNVDRIITGDGDGPLQRAPVSSCVMPGGRKIVADVDATRRDASRPADAARK